MSYCELYKVISKPWITTSEIMIIAGVGRNKAGEIRKEIEEEIIDSGKKLPPSANKVIPTEKLLERLGLDSNHIYEMAMKEKSLY